MGHILSDVKGTEKQIPGTSQQIFVKQVYVLLYVSSLKVYDPVIIYLFLKY